MNDGISHTPIQRVRNLSLEGDEDVLAIEEPLEIRLGFGSKQKRVHKSVSITMRTPGNDAELALGFLFTEGIIKNHSEVSEVKPCGPLVKGSSARNTIRIELSEASQFDFRSLDRHFYTSSSCGVCGKTSIEALRVQIRFPLKPQTRISASYVHELPEKLRMAQGIFESTGGLHASALFSTEGKLICVKEDVGRHNALDKVIGWAFTQRNLPLANHVVMLSGRVSFELVQKAAMAGVSILAAVGAPSSLAVELAKEVNMTLLGFVRNQRFNIYSGQERVRHEA